MLTAIDRPMLAAASVDETKSDGVHTGRLGLLETTHHISWGTGVTAGVVEIEVADDPAYTGTWAPVATVTFSGTAPKQDYVRVAGAYKAMRHRISTAVADGTVSSRIVGSV